MKKERKIIDLLLKTYLLPRFLNLMDEGGEMTLNLKIVKAPAKILRQLSFKLQNEISKAVYVEQLYEIHNLVT